MGARRSWFDRWQARAAGILALVATCVGIYSQLPRSPVDGRAEVARLELELEEYGRHLAETPERREVIFRDARGALEVAGFPDGCALVVRTDVAGRTFSRLVMDLARAPRQASVYDFEYVISSHIPVLEAAGQGRCAPHQDRPAWRWGARLDSCRVQVFFDYVDGCILGAVWDSCQGSLVGAPTCVRGVH